MLVFTIASADDGMAMAPIMDAMVLHIRTTVCVNCLHSSSAVFTVRAMNYV